MFVAANTLLEAIQAKSPSIIETEAVILQLGKSPGWKDSNFQVVTVAVNILTVLSKMPSFGKAAASIVIPSMMIVLSFPSYLLIYV